MLGLHKGKKSRTLDRILANFEELSLQLRARNAARAWALPSQRRPLLNADRLKAPVCFPAVNVGYVQRSVTHHCTETFGGLRLNRRLATVWLKSLVGCAALHPPYVCSVPGGIAIGRASPANGLSRQGTGPGFPLSGSARRMLIVSYRPGSSTAGMHPLRSFCAEDPCPKSDILSGDMCVGSSGAVGGAHRAAASQRPGRPITAQCRYLAPLAASLDDQRHTLPRRCVGSSVRRSYPVQPDRDPGRP